MNLYSLIALVLFQVLFFFSIGNSFTVPGFINRVPSGHFAGVSAPCADLQTARNSSIADVVKKVLDAINGKYNYSYTSRVTGNPRSPIIHIQENFTRIASGVVLDVEQDIVKSAYVINNSGDFISFILVRYPDGKIREMRRLSKGSNLVASILSNKGGVLLLKMVETNGVAVTLASTNIKITKKNRLARFYRFCIWKVPFGSNQSFTIALDPIEISNESSILKLDHQQAQKNWKDYLLGSKLVYKIKFNGFDELGRSVSTSIEF